MKNLFIAVILILISNFANGQSFSMQFDFQVSKDTMIKNSYSIDYTEKTKTLILSNSEADSDTRYIIESVTPSVSKTVFNANDGTRIIVDKSGRGIIFEFNDEKIFYCNHKPSEAQKRLKLTK